MPPPLSRDEVAYYRAHIQEALAEDRVVCLECGRAYRELGPHLRHKHALTSDAYREKWGYNRGTALISGGRRSSRRDQALAHVFAALSPPGSGTHPLPGTTSPRRR